MAQKFSLFCFPAVYIVWGFASCATSATLRAEYSAISSTVNFPIFSILSAISFLLSFKIVLASVWINGPLIVSPSFFLLFSAVFNHLDIAMNTALCYPTTALSSFNIAIRNISLFPVSYWKDSMFSIFVRMSYIAKTEICVTLFACRCFILSEDSQAVLLLPH